MKVFKLTVDNGATVLLEVYSDWDLAEKRVTEILHTEYPSILQLLESYRVDFEKPYEFHMKIFFYDLSYTKKENYMKVESHELTQNLSILAEAVDMDVDARKALEY